ncbi:hypothetical protein ACFT41_32075, partial [Micromonospora sp. NPDC057141]
AQAQAARQDAAALSARLAEATAAHDAAATGLAAAREATAAAEGRLGELEVRLRAVEAERDAAQRRSAQLVDQVSDLATALARLGTGARHDR